VTPVTFWSNKGNCPPARLTAAHAAAREAAMAAFAQPWRRKGLAAGVIPNCHMRGRLACSATGVGSFGMGQDHRHLLRRRSALAAQHGCCGAHYDSQGDQNCCLVSIDHVPDLHLWPCVKFKSEFPFLDLNCLHRRCAYFVKPKGLSRKTLLALFW